MHPLRLAPWWLAGGALLVLLVVIGSVVPKMPSGVVTPFDKLNHLVAYFVLMAWFGGIFRRAKYVWVAVALFLLGAGLEFVQALTAERHAEVADMLANATGIGIGLVPGLIIARGWCRYVEDMFVRAQ